MSNRTAIWPLGMVAESLKEGFSQVRLLRPDAKPERPEDAGDRACLMAGAPSAAALAVAAPAFRSDAGCATQARRRSSPVPVAAQARGGCGIDGEAAGGVDQS